MDWTSASSLEFLFKRKKNSYVSFTPPSEHRKGTWVQPSKLCISPLCVIWSKMPGDVFLLNRQRGGVALPSNATLTKVLITKKNVCFRYLHKSTPTKNRNKIVMVAKKKRPEKNKIGSRKKPNDHVAMFVAFGNAAKGPQQVGHHSSYRLWNRNINGQRLFLLLMKFLFWVKWSEVWNPFAMHWWHQPFRSAALKNTQNGSCTCSASLRSAGQLPLKSWLKSNRRNRQALNRNYPLTSLEQLSGSFLLEGASLLGLMYVFGDLDRWPEWKECQICLVSYLIRAATKQFPPSFKHYSTTRHLWLVAPRHLPGLAFNGKSVDCWKGQPINSL